MKIAATVSKVGFTKAIKGLCRDMLWLSSPISTVAVSLMLAIVALLLSIVVEISKAFICLLIIALSALVTWIYALAGRRFNLIERMRVAIENRCL